MKVKEYIENFSFDSFYDNLANEFLALLELNKANNNIKGFDNALRCIRMKFDSISKQLPEVQEKHWKYFFATIVTTLRDQFCEEQHAQRVEQKKKKHEAYESYRRQERFWEESFRKEQQYYWEQVLDSLLSRVSNVPIKSLEFLSLSENCTVDDINKQYKELSKKYHPDAGGSHSDFIALVEHKNLCLRWRSN